jgi:sulfoxide reductase heme-binding subunit YedZ
MSWRTGVLVFIGLAISVIAVRIAENGGAGTSTWDFTRASGFAGYVLLWLSVCGGMVTGFRGVPAFFGSARWIELHRIVAVLAASFVAAHVLGLLLDPFMPFSPVELLVPLASEYRAAWVGLGTLAMWLLAIVLISTALFSRLGWRRWHLVHLLSYPAYVMAFVHGVMAGTDSGATLALALYASSAAMVAALTVYRLAGPAPRPRRTPRVELASGG